jgi:hypothetical protein
MATAYALVADAKAAQNCITEARKALQKESKQNTVSANSRASVPLFIKLRNEEVERECTRVKTFLSRVDSGKGIVVRTLR